MEILADENDNVNKIRCIKMELGEPDASGRRRPIEVPGSEFELDVDCVIMALGTSPNPLIKSTTKGLEINKKGGIVVNEDGLTSREHVYAGGDAVTGAATVILGHGRRQDCCQGHRRSSQQVKNPIIKKSCRIAAGFFYKEC
ncbi:MAG: FAD-dependent oxidoreductase [Dysosmobacter sp.]